MNRFLFEMIGSIVLLAMLLYSLGSDGQRVNPSDRSAAENAEPIKLYCAASNRAVVEEIRQQYEAETQRRVEIQYGPSQVLLSSLEVGQDGDLYLPADDSYIDLARNENVVKEAIPLAEMRIGLVVKQGNPLGITSFDDLLKDNVRVVQADPDGAAVGQLTRSLLEKTGKWTQLHIATTAYRATVTDVANDIVLGAADAGIVYDAVLATYSDLEFVELPEFKEGISRISVGVASFTKRPAAAFHFARYLAAKDRGQKQYEKLGFTPVNGDEWADRPELEIFAGSMLRPAIEETVAQFQTREGVEIITVYNGCGILVGQMNEQGSQPDAYFACDVEFMNQVREKFEVPETISQNQLVIVVQKGNPQDIKNLRDLTRPGLRVGIGHEKQCAMGWLTQLTLSEGGVQQEVMANVTVQTPTGDLLVNQMKAGSLDAAVVYLSNTVGSGDVLDAIAITGLPCSQASQPIAIAKETPYRQLIGRFLDQIHSAQSKERFLSNGFQWQVEDAQ